MEFHNLGKTNRKRCLMAGNQVGKTFSASMECAYHLTGKYPDWWEGRRFFNPSRAWVGGPNSEHVRDNAQRLLFGTSSQEGTGSIPAVDIVQIERSRGIKNAIDYAMIRHKSGGLSYIKFKSYDQETDVWSGDTLNFIWYDEEPPEDKYTEGITRTNAGDNGKPGMIFLTLTPVLGLTRVARRFHPHPHDKDSAIIRMGLKDAKHFSDEDIESIASTYPDYERKARVEGYPQLGEGAVFPVNPDVYTIDPPGRESWWVYLGGIDFGWDHPCGAVEIGWDRDTDVLYVLREYRQSRARTPDIASALRRWGEWLPWAWPHDGYIHDRQSGSMVAELFREEGMNMMHTHSTYPDGTYGFEASILEMNNRLASGRLKISKTCTGLISEMESYHRENGRVVKLDDDVISACRYAMMMRRNGSLEDGFSKNPTIIGKTDYQPWSN